jgi:DNA-binding Xre family transcriptional regulator
MKLGEIIKKQAEKKGIKEVDLRKSISEELKPNLVYHSRYNHMKELKEKKLNNCRLDELQIICDVLKISATELLNFK